MTSGVAIDEEGVTAAAYTAMSASDAAMPPEDEVDFVLDRPFLFVLTNEDGLPLFAGDCRAAMRGKMSLISIRQHTKRHKVIEKDIRNAFFS